MKFNPIQNIIHFVHYKLTLGHFKHIGIYNISEFNSRISVGGGLWGITFGFLLWLHFNLGFDFSFIRFIFQKTEDKLTFIVVSLFSILFSTFILFRPVKFKTFWKIHKSITKNNEYYKQLKRKFIFQFIAVVCIFFVIRAFLKYYYQN